MAYNNRYTNKVLEPNREPDMVLTTESGYNVKFWITNFHIKELEFFYQYETQSWLSGTVSRGKVVNEELCFAHTLTSGWSFWGARTSEDELSSADIIAGVEALIKSIEDSLLRDEQCE